MAKQTKITIETDSLVILRGRCSRPSWCPLCGAAVQTIALEEAEVLSKVERHAWAMWMESAALHQLAAADGSVLICVDSLLTCVQKPKSN